MKAITLRWHRNLAWLAGFTLLLWASSGLLHPVMSWTNPQPATFKPPVEVLHGVPSGDLQTLQQRGVHTLSGLRWLQMSGEVVLQVATPDHAEKRYLSWPAGAELLRLDQVRAEWLARHYAGEATAAIADATLITDFDSAYPAVNRLLPVWRVQFERPDHLSVYVETGSDRLSAINDTRKEWLLAIFLNVHKLHFLQAFEGGRVALIGTAVLSVLTMGLLGLGMLALLRRRQKATGARTAHRALAYVVWAPLLMFSVSGLFHLLTYTSLRKPAPDDRLSSIAVSKLQALPGLKDVSGLSLIPIASDQGWWRVAAGEGLTYREAVSKNASTADEAAFVRLIAQQHGLPEQAIVVQERITRFTDEYGFANKRLPVWRVQGSNGALLFVDAQSGVLAAKVEAVDLVEGWSFSNLHKWQFFNPLGRAARDGILVFFALLLIVTTVAGLSLRLRAHRREL